MKVETLPQPTGAMALETFGLTKRFGAFTALDNVTMKVAPGTVHALLGENGAGKSTLVKCIAGFHRAEAGSVMPLLASDAWHRQNGGKDREARRWAKLFDKKA